MNELSSKAKQGEDYKQFAARIEAELLDEKKQVFYIPYLKKLGFQHSWKVADYSRVPVYHIEKRN